MVAHRKRELYVEGGGDRNSSLASECRRAFSKLFENDGLQEKPRVIACGGRKRAYDQFCEALARGATEAWLLVDAEDVPSGGPSRSPWDHVKSRTGDKWQRPANARDEQLHLMSVVMETWLIADPAALTAVFGAKFDTSKLPAGARLEATPKQEVFAALKAATARTPAREYGKGPHSFKILAKVSPTAIRKLTWGKRFLDAMATPE